MTFDNFRTSTVDFEIRKISEDGTYYHEEIKMSKEDVQWEIIKLLCPKLYRHGITFECHRGWGALIYDISLKLEKLIEEIENQIFLRERKKLENPEIYAIQVKEKYGTLRFYMSYGNDEIINLIKAVEYLSKHTCEICGAHGKLRRESWIKTRCDNCYEEKI